MYLSRLVLDPRSREARRDLADCHAMHRAVMSAFPDVTSGEARSALGVLYRVEPREQHGGIVVLVQSQVAPDWSRLAPDYLARDSDLLDNPAYKQIDESRAFLDSDAPLVFRLRANPTRKIDTKSGPDGRRRNGRRVELRDEPSQLAWLQRKADQSGFRLLSVRTDSSIINTRAASEGKLRGQRGRDDSGTLTVASVLFEGELEVRDQDRFRTALRQGIGPGKAWGLGLLSVARRCD